MSKQNPLKEAIQSYLDNQAKRMNYLQNLMRRKVRI